MIIKRLELDQFAGLTDFKLELTDGINVSYGENGTGKTTLGLFIRAMLYGVSGDRKRDDVTMRMRIIPIGAQKAGGRMILEIKNRPLEIERSFGRTKKFDRSRLTWLDDGSRPEITGEPGDYLLGLNEETFSRTFFVGEMNQAVLPGSTGELTSHLMNLSVTGHENMDYHKALKKLKDEARGISNQRGTGRFDELLREKEKLTENLKTAGLLKQDLEQLLSQKEEDEKRKLELAGELSVLQQKTDSLEQLKELEDYEQAMLLLAKKTDLESRIEKIKVPFGLEQITEMKSQLEQFLREETILDQRVAAHNEETAQLTELESAFNPEYDRLFDTSNERRVRELLAEKEMLDSRMALLLGLTPIQIELFDSLANQTAARDRGREKIKPSPSLNPDKNTQGAEHSAKVTGLSTFLQNSSGLFRRNKTAESTCGFILTVLLAIISGLYGVGSQHYAVSALGVLAALGLGYVSLVRNRRRLAEGSAEAGIIRDRLKDEHGQETYLKLMELLDEGRVSPELVLTRLRENYRELEDRVRNIGLTLPDLVDFLKEQAHYVNAKEQWQKGLGLLEESHRFLQTEQERISRVRLELAAQLAPAGLSCDEAGAASLGRQLNQLEIRLSEEKELAATMAELSELSEARNLNPILLEPHKPRADGVRRELDLQRQLKRDTDQLKAQISGLDLQIVRTAGQIESVKTRLAAQDFSENNLRRIDEELERLDLRKRILELATEQLEESYREIQRNYLPRVSRKVSETFRQLTGGRFDQVVLSGDYRMMVPLGGELSNMDYLSRGNLDLLWLGLRLSLCDIIMRGEKVPLIFDDSFLHLDEDRLKSVLSYLNERIDSQILILTCHHRETRLLKEMDLLQ